MERLYTTCIPEDPALPSSKDTLSATKLQELSMEYGLAGIIIEYIWSNHGNDALQVLDLIRVAAGQGEKEAHAALCMKKNELQPERVVVGSDPDPAQKGFPGMSNSSKNRILD